MQLLNIIHLDNTCSIKRKKTQTQLIKKVGKGVTLTSHMALAVVFLSPLQGHFAVSPAWTRAEPSEGMRNLQLLKAKGS